MNRRDLLKCFVAVCALPAKLLHCRPVPQAVIGVDLAKGESFTVFELQGLPLPIVHRDFGFSRSLADCARARGLDEKTIREMEEYEQGLKRNLVMNGMSCKPL